MKNNYIANTGEAGARPEKEMGHAEAQPTSETTSPHCTSAESASPQSRKEPQIENAFWLGSYPDADFDFDPLCKAYKHATGGKRPIVKVRPALCAVACSALSAYRSGKHVLYLRTKNTKGVDNRLTADIVDYFAARRLIQHTKGYWAGDSHDGMASHFQGTPELAKLMAGSKIGRRDYRPHDHLVELRDSSGKVIASFDTARTPTAKSVRDLNIALSKSRIEIDGERVTGVSFKRVFNLTMQKGGRLYHQVQTLSKIERKGITINGERVAEKDFSAMHIALAYAKAGLNPPAEDPYTINDYPRDAMKLVSLVTLNGGGTAGIRLKFLESGLTPLIPHIADMRAAFLDRHQPIAEIVGTPDIGLELQHLDSKVAERVLMEMMSRGAPALGWHDSFLAQRSREDELVQVMRNEYADIIGFEPPAIK